MAGTASTSSTSPQSRGGFSCELNFLTHIQIMNNNNNKDSIWNHLQGEGTISTSGTYTPSAAQTSASKVTIFKQKETPGSEIKNYYKETIYRSNTLNKNPYIQLIEDFETTDHKALLLRPADFAYLKNLGVFPLNRLWILRRFKEGDTVPDNLLDWEGAPHPTSTVIGWIPPDEDNFFNMSFNEEWTTQTDRVDEVLSRILDDEFGFKTKAVQSIPGWSQGILMGFLEAMGMTNFSFDKIPFGDPNVLQEAATRVADPTKSTYGLRSKYSQTLKTTYEQKFIGEIDPGSAFLDIIRNLTLMGTSDVVYFSSDNEIFAAIREASAQGNNLDLWWDVIKVMVTKFVEAVQKLLVQGADLIKGQGKTSATEINNPLANITGGIIKTILSSTVAKYKWPLKAGIGVMTGENTTPWHLTIGNPYSPVVSFGNVKVESVTLKMNNELGFNDIPTRIDVDISVSLGRNIGAQEIFGMFNNGYMRSYDTSASDETTSPF